MIRLFLNKTNLRYIVTGVLLTSLLVLSVLFIKQRKAHELATQPRVLPSVSYYPVPKSMGPDSAPIKIIEYSDFECPSCRFATEVLHQLFATYSGKIQLVYHHYPLTGHPWSAHAHQAAECMHIQGKFWPYHDMLYRNQREWAAMPEAPVPKLMEYAEGCGANMELFLNCMADPAVTSGIYAEKNEGTLRQVNATPTFFMGDKRYVGARELQERGENDIRRVLGLPELSFSAPPEPQAEQTPKPPTAVPGGE